MYHKGELQDMLLALMQIVYKAQPDELIEMVGIALGDTIPGLVKQPEQELGEWRSYDCDGYKFRIRRDLDGKLEIGREEI